MTTVATNTSTAATVEREGRGAGHYIKLVLSYGVLFLLAAAFIYPFLLAIGTSFKTLPEINQTPVSIIPREFTLEGYQRLFSFNVGRWTINSAIVAVLIDGFNMCYPGAYVPSPIVNVKLLVTRH